MKSLHRYIYTIAGVLISAVLFSCSEDDKFLAKDASKLSITLQLGEMTRATEAAGVDNLNENKISTIDVFLFGASDDDNTPAVFYERVTNGSMTPGNDGKSASFDLNISLTKYNILFPDGNTNTCKAYAIVNRPAGCELPAANKRTLAALKRLVINSEKFQSIDETTKSGKRLLTKQQMFVMDGYTAQITRNDMTLSGTIPLKRAAVKIQLQVDIEDNVSDNGTTWTADKQNVRMTVHHGCNRAYLNEATPANYLKLNKASDLFDIEEISLDIVNGIKIPVIENDVTVEKDGVRLTTSLPIYTYPTYWGNDDDCRTYIILIVDWIDNNTENKQPNRTTYYEIPVNVAGDYLARNSFYKIKQGIGIIGSETEEEAQPELERYGYNILPWGSVKYGTSGTQTDAEISSLKYLVLEETDIELQNSQTKDFFYFTSDPITIKNVTVKRVDTSGTLATTVDINGNLEQNGNIYTFTGTETDSTKSSYLKKQIILEVHTADPNVPGDKDYINFRHELVNDMTKTSDYSEYIITFEVGHDGTDTEFNKFKETVTVDQYPMIAIKATLNSDCDNTGNLNAQENNDKKGYVIVNYRTDGTNNDWDGVGGMVQSKNPNRYVISVSSLTAGSTYIVGDPRSKDVSNPTGMKNDYYGNNLTMYYPTNAANTSNMISPQFMVASSYGACTDSSLDEKQAKNRCATYQEDGYPAGRWRVPTKAEIRYITQLSAWGIIPALFSNNMNYWSAQGLIQVNGNSVQDSSGASGVVRCVYDTWYWGTEQLTDKTKFTYGDKQR